MQQINGDTGNGTPPGDANVIPALPNYLTSKLGKDESTDFPDHVFEETRDHEFRCDSDNNIFEAKAIDEASIDTSTSRFKSVVDDNKNIVANIDKNFVELDIELLK